jgi:tyrosyl-tRNA synthetase
MTKGDGLSFAEFSYPLLQAWDWWHMYSTKGIQLQIGGADQYGNIITGINAINYILTTHPDPDIRKLRKGTSPVGFTVPLLTTASGEKFGKSAGNAIWLDQGLTSSFDLYGFFMRQPDADVERYLRLFTFLPLEMIDTVVKEHMKEPKLRKAQHLLAREVVEIVHGIEQAKSAENQHRLLFSNSSNSAASVTIPEDDKKSDKQKQMDFITLNNSPNQNITLPRSLIYSGSVASILYAADFAVSISHGHRQITQGSIYVAGGTGEKLARLASELTYTRVQAWGIGELAKFLMNDKLLVLRRGKHNIKMVNVVSDEEWKASGNTYPGEDEVQRKIKQQQLTLESMAPQNEKPKEPAPKNKKKLASKNRKKLAPKNKKKLAPKLEKEPAVGST